MRILLITLLSVLALNSTAVANAANISGGVASSPAVHTPYLYLTATHVNANEPFIAFGGGFTPGAAITVTIAVTGQSPYASGSTSSDARGNASVGIMFTGCGGAPPYDITVRFTDTYGINASARVEVC